MKVLSINGRDVTRGVDYATHPDVTAWLTSLKEWPDGPNFWVNAANFMRTATRYKRDTIARQQTQAYLNTRRTSRWK
jgi:hypothetical protein